MAGNVYIGSRPTACYTVYTYTRRAWRVASSLGTVTVYRSIYSSSRHFKCSVNCEIKFYPRIGKRVTCRPTRLRPNRAVKLYELVFWIYKKQIWKQFYSNALGGGDIAETQDSAMKITCWNSLKGLYAVRLCSFTDTKNGSIYKCSKKYEVLPDRR